MEQNKALRICLIATILFVLIQIAGCATKTVTEYKTVEVLVPTRVPCSVATPDLPAWVVPLVKPGSDIYTQMRALLADRELSKAYEQELRTALEACKK
jgi:hypothetical protein